MTEQTDTVWIVIRDNGSWIDGVYQKREDAKEYAKSHLPEIREQSEYGEVLPKSVEYVGEDETILVERHGVYQ